MRGLSPAASSVLSEELLAELSIDGERRQVVWIHDQERRVSVLVDRPMCGNEKPLLLGILAPAEGREAIDALLAEYRESYAGRPSAARPRPRALEPDDLLTAR